MQLGWLFVTTSDSKFSITENTLVESLEGVSGSKMHFKGTLKGINKRIK